MLYYWGRRASAAAAIWVSVGGQGVAFRQTVQRRGKQLRQAQGQQKQNHHRQGDGLAKGAGTFGKQRFVLHPMGRSGGA